MRNKTTSKSRRWTLSDVTYILSSTMFDGAGRRLYKFGITSEAMAEQRLLGLKRAARSFNLEYVMRALTGRHAAAVEGQLLSLGEPLDLKGFDGYSEYRWLTEEQLQQARSILTKWANAVREEELQFISNCAVQGLVDTKCETPVIQGL